MTNVRYSSRARWQGSAAGIARYLAVQIPENLQTARTGAWVFNPANGARQSRTSCFLTTIWSLASAVTRCREASKLSQCTAQEFVIAVILRRKTAANTSALCSSATTVQQSSFSPAGSVEWTNSVSWYSWGCHRQESKGCSFVSDDWVQTWRAGKKRIDPVTPPAQ
jgi:hypothetical protein